MPRAGALLSMLLVAWVVAAAPAQAQEGLASLPRDRVLERRAPSPWHGPIEVREHWLLSQPRLSLPPCTPDVLPCGRSTWRLVVDRGSDFGWNQTSEGENPFLRRFLVDGEQQTMAVEWRRGLGGGFDLGVRATAMWRGAGFMDGPIDAFHEFTGLMDNIRSAFRTDLFRVEGIDREGNPLSWNDEQGWGLGPAEVSLRAALPALGFGGATALVGRASLPTGSGPFARSGVDLGLQIVHARVLAPRLRLYAGAGATWFTEREIDGFEYRPFRPSAFMGVEWRAWARTHVVLDVVASGALLDNLAGYPSEHVYFDFGVVHHLSPRSSLEVHIRENLFDQQSTTDFGLLVGFTYRL